MVEALWVSCARTMVVANRMANNVTTDSHTVSTPNSKVPFTHRRSAALSSYAVSYHKAQSF